MRFGTSVRQRERKITLAAIKLSNGWDEDPGQKGAEIVAEYLHERGHFTATSPTFDWKRVPYNHITRKREDNRYK